MLNLSVKIGYAITPSSIEPNAFKITASKEISKETKPLKRQFVT